MSEKKIAKGGDKDISATPAKEVKPKGKGQGQKARSESELRQAFADMKKTINNSSLKLQVQTRKDNKGIEKTRCTVICVDGEDGVDTVLGPVAGNTFMRQIEGAYAFLPYVG